MAFSEYLVAMAVVFVMSIGCSLLSFRKNREFSLNIFLSSMAIGVSILVWVRLLPTFTIVISVLMIVIMLFTEKSGSVSSE